MRHLIITDLMQFLKVGKHHIKMTNNSIYSNKFNYSCAQDSNARGWLNKWNASPTVCTSITNHSICIQVNWYTSNLYSTSCKLLYSYSQGWQPCIGTGGSWFPVRIPHKINGWTAEVAFHLFLQNQHTAVETFRLQTKAAREMLSHWWVPWVLNEMLSHW
jgi:hypothetical protein